MMGTYANWARIPCRAGRHRAGSRKRCRQPPGKLGGSPGVKSRHLIQGIGVWGKQPATVIRTLAVVSEAWVQLNARLMVACAPPSRARGVAHTGSTGGAGAIRPITRPPTRASPPPRKSQADRLWGKVNRSNPESCWEWAGSRDGYGYGYFRMQPSESMWRAHRAAWVITFGPVPDGNRVLHRCDNPPCINPAHLFLGTDQDNVADRVAKNRSSRAVTHFGETSPLAKLTAMEVAEIRRRYAEGFVYQRELASEFGISQTEVGRIVRGVRWKQAHPPSQS